MSLPGNFRIGIARDHDGCGCEGAEGCERPVYGRLCTEADSFGAEWMHLCKIHYLAAQCYKRLAPPELDDCDWCRAVNVETVPTRDTDEGSNGPVYHVCIGCRQKQVKRDAEELEAYDQEHYDELSDLYSEAEEYQAEDDDVECDEDFINRKRTVTVLGLSPKSTNAAVRTFVKKP